MLLLHRLGIATLSAPALHARVFVHVVAPDGQLVAQNDGDPINGLAPNFTWSPGAIITDPRAVLFQAPLPEGSYEVRVGLYDPNTGERVLTSSRADHAVVGHIVVVP
ncbi:MAG: hypothetical protein RMJ86_00180 [Anaerolineae bacterium]|nr:hypothetical protein [Thermoflexales bacterium]MDW8052952.1 hypothetical protein [Anaerolineae bacterium]